MGYDSLWVADYLFLGHEDAILEGWDDTGGAGGRDKAGKDGRHAVARFLQIEEVFLTVIHGCPSARFNWWIDC
jgi:hypothetical protein